MARMGAVAPLSLPVFRRLIPAALAVCLALPLHADTFTPGSFTWSPSAIGLTGGTITNANNFNVTSFETTTVTDGSGDFTASGALNVAGFLHGGGTVASSGLGSTYSLYFVFSGSGNLGGPIPGIGQTDDGSFSSLNYTLYAYSGSTPTYSTGAGGVTITGNTGAFAIATGSLDSNLSDSVTLTNTGGGLSPTSSFAVSLIPTAAGTNFFTSPSGSQYLDINLSSTTTVVTSNANQYYVNGGGGNVQDGTVAVTATPEPGSLALLATGLAGVPMMLGRLRRRA